MPLDDGTGVYGLQPHTPLLSKSDLSKDAAPRALSTYFPFSEHHGGQREPNLRRDARPDSEYHDYDFQSYIYITT